MLKFVSGSFKHIEDVINHLW